MYNAKIYLEIAGNCTVPDNWDLSNVGKRIQRLYYIKGGSGKIILDNSDDIPFVPGSIYIMPGNMKQRFISDETDRLDHIYFDFYSFPPIIADEPIIYNTSGNLLLQKQIAFLDELTLLDRKAIFDDNKPDISVNEYIGINKNTPSGSLEEYNQLVKNSFYALLLTLSSIKEIPFINDEAITSVLEYIFLHYSEPISLDELAKMAGYEKHYYIRRFKEIMSETPYSYLRNYRIERARAFLEEGMPINLAAQKVGYQNPDSLYKLLKRK